MDFGLFRSDTEYLFLRRTLYYMSSQPSDIRGAYSQIALGEHVSESMAVGDDQSSMDPSVRGLKAKDSGASLHEMMQLDHMDNIVLESADDDAAAVSVAAVDEKVIEMANPAAINSPDFGQESSKIDILADAASTLVKRTPSEFVSIEKHEINRRGNPSSSPSSPDTPSKPPLSSSSGRLVVGGGHATSRYRPLLPSTPVLYYAAIILDFLLRVLWSFKLSVHLHLTSEGLTFVLEICEVFRRFIWLFFRIEWQCIEMQEDELLAESAASWDRRDSDTSNSESAHAVNARQTGTTKVQMRSRANVDRSP
jgi:hypothetical protein